MLVGRVGTTQRKKNLLAFALTVGDIGAYTRAIAEKE